MFVPPPPLPIHGAFPASEQRPGDIARLKPERVMCDGTIVTPTRLETPFVTSAKRFGPDVQNAAPRYSLDFDIDAEGRPVNIHPEQMVNPIYYVDTGDLAPSLAVSRFLAGDPRHSCSVSYSVSLIPVPDAPPSLLYEVASAPTPGMAQDEIFAKVSADGDCRSGPGSPRQLNYPDFESISQPAGTRGWSFLRFDVDDKGKVRNARVVGSSGNAALDAASVKALRENRYAAGKAARGCTFNFYRLSSEPLPAPAMPEDAPKDNGELPACTIDPKAIPSLLNGNAYPAAFSARRVAGYAIVGFDTAPWGGVGNVHVLASQPDVSFGEAAMQAIYNAKVPESDTGHRGCVRRVIFRLPKEKPAA